MLAHGKVLYKGHAVAAVAATSPHVAEEALKLIKVEYEPLPAVTWVLDAMKADAPLLHDDVCTDSMGKKSDKPSNVATHIHFEMGDVDKGFAKADVVIEREFKTASVHQGYIEPHDATALWNADGHLTIWTSTQGSFTARAADGRAVADSRLAGHGRAVRDRRRLRRQDRRLSRAGRRAAQPQVRPAGQDDDEPRRRLRGHRPDARLVHPRQAGRDERRQARRPARPGWPTTPARFPAA